MTSTETLGPTATLGPSLAEVEAAKLEGKRWCPHRAGFYPAGTHPTPEQIANGPLGRAEAQRDAYLQEQAARDDAERTKWAAKFDEEQRRCTKAMADANEAFRDLGKALGVPADAELDVRDMVRSALAGEAEARGSTVRWFRAKFVRQPDVTKMSVEQLLDHVNGELQKWGWELVESETSMLLRTPVANNDHDEMWAAGTPLALDDNGKVRIAQDGDQVIGLTAAAHSRGDMTVLVTLQPVWVDEATNGAAYQRSFLDPGSRVPAAPATVAPTPAPADPLRAMLDPLARLMEVMNQCKS